MVLEKMGEKFTKYEIARILGARALQLAMDAPVLLKIDKEKLEEINYDVIQIAEFEFEEGVLPITVKRPFPKKAEDAVKKIVKEKQEAEAKEVTKEGKKAETDDKKVEEKEGEEEKDIVEEGEIMELVKPEDETESGEAGGEEGEA